MRKLFAVVLLGLLTVAQPARADDPAATFLVKLFINVCTPNMGQPDKIRAWANEHHLQAT